MTLRARKGQKPLPKQRFRLPNNLILWSGQMMDQAWPIISKWEWMILSRAKDGQGKFDFLVHF